MPDLQAPKAPGAWIPGASVTCEPPEASAITFPATSYEHASDFHDRERFYPENGTKSFAIMEKAAGREARVTNGSGATSGPLPALLPGRSRALLPAAPGAASRPRRLAARAAAAPRRGTALGVATGATAMVCVGGSVAVSKVLAGAPVCTAEAVRYGAACLLLVALAKLTGRKLTRPRGTEWLWLGGIAVTGLVLFNLALVEGSGHAEPAVLGVAVACVPAVLAIIGPLLEGSRPGKRPSPPRWSSRAAPPWSRASAAPTPPAWPGRPWSSAARPRSPCSPSPS